MLFTLYISVLLIIFLTKSSTVDGEVIGLIAV